MDTDAYSDTTHDSLADSTYEIISAANTRSSDDEESHQDDSESLMSFGDPAFHEHGANSQRDYVSPEASRVITPAPDTSDDEAEVKDTTIPHQSNQYGNLSELTENIVLQTPRHSMSFDPVALEDASSLTEISHTVDSSGAYFYAGRKLERPRVSIHQTVAPTNLEVKQTFRILWHGDTAYHDNVIQKIGQALAVSSDKGLESSVLRSSSSRFTIVPLSAFGGNELPEVTMIPASTEIALDICKTCQTNMEERTHHFHRHSKLKSTSYPSDLEIFFHNDASTESQPFADIRPFTTNPFLDIRQSSPSLNIKPIRPCFGKAVHMCVEEPRRHSPKGDCTLKEVPIDLDHFQDLDPALLNRNIQCLLIDEPQMTKGETVLKTVKHAYLELARTVEERTGSSLFKIVGLIILTLLFKEVIYQSTASIIGSTRSTPQESSVLDAQTIDTTATVTVTSTIQSTASASAINASMLNATPSSVSITGTRDVGAPLSDAHPRPSFKFEFLRTEEGKLYLKLPLEMVKLRRPPPLRVTAYVGEQEKKVILSKWNASMYSVEVKDFDFSQPITIIVDSEKASGVRQAFYIDSRAPWIGMRSIELGLSACLATSREVAQVARKELALFRDQANGLILSSSDWLQEYMKSVRRSSGTAAGDLWERLSSRRDVIAKFVEKSGPQVLQNAREHMVAVNSALSERITALIETGKDFEKSLVEKTDTRTRRLRQGFGKLSELRTLPSPGYNPLVEARHRARFLARKAGGMLSSYKRVGWSKQRNREHHQAANQPNQCSRALAKERTCASSSCRDCRYKGRARSRKG